MNIKIFKQVLVVIFLIAFFIYFACPSLDPLVVYEYKTSKVNRDKHIRVKGERDAALAQVQYLKSQLEALQAEPDSSHLDVDDITDTAAAISLLQAQVDNAEQILSNRIDQVAEGVTNEFNTRLDNLESDIRDIDGNINADYGIFDRIDELESKTRDNSNELQNIITNYINDLSNNIENINSNINEMDSNIDNIDSNIDNLNSDVNEMDNNIDDLNMSDISGIQSIINVILSDISGIQSTLDSSYVPTAVDNWLQNTYITQHDHTAHFH